MNKSDFLVIGSGVAGLFFALRAAEHGTVSVVTKKGGSDTTTNLAQGGIASVQSSGDSFDLHIKDTLECGAGLCRPDIVEMVVHEGPVCIQDLVDIGVRFTMDGGSFALGREGGHSVNRIVFASDFTGREIQRVLISNTMAHPNIRFFQNHMAVGLIQPRHLEDRGAAGDSVHGAYILDTDTGKIEPFPAGRTMLATGGAGKVYLYTSNPDVATGDGIAMAYRAGAEVANLEFVQFHPTCLYHPEAKSFLLSEALRGEGGLLRREDGSRFMDEYDPKAELAPRDIVARAIDREMKLSAAKWMYLDMTHLNAGFLRERFQQINQRCLDLGLDFTRDQLPVVPATHYFCGGLSVDSWGRTNLQNLIALGEVGHTGLHGANRLASNSLLEAVVFARRAAQKIEEDASLMGEPIVEPTSWDEGRVEAVKEAVIIDHDWDAARRIMWDYVGIVRSDERLRLAADRIEQLKSTVESLYWGSRLTQDLLELRNIILVGELVIRSARERRESRGLHFTESHPQRDDEHSGHDTVLRIDERGTS